MKSIFAILAMFVGIACFAEVYDSEKSRTLNQTANTTKKIEDRKALKDYIINTEFNKDYTDMGQVHKLVTMVVDFFQKKKTIPTRSALVEQMDKTYKLEDERARETAIGRAMIGLKMYKELEAEMPKLIETRTGMEDWAYSTLCSYNMSLRDYDNAIKFGKLCKNIVSVVSNLQMAYESKGMYKESFEAGRDAFLNAYILNPKTAMSIITRMMNRVPDSYDDAKLADLLAKIGKKYPAPGADFEAWKGFMGFIGYRYKALTGKDLFANSNK